MKFFKKSDIIVILVLLVFAIAFAVLYRLINTDKSAVAEIYYNSELVETVDLNTGIDKTFSIPQDDHVIFHLYKDGAIRFEESDCPDKICVKAGKLSIVGESAACLPNKIVIKIVPKSGYSDDDIDIIIGK
jgi:hypothetical protein